eukprot:s2123_g10.t1
MLDRREPLAPTELMMATRELDLLRTLAPTLQEPHPLQQLRDVDWMDQEEAASPENLDRPSKWQKPGPKGAQHGKGKNRGPPQLPRYDSSWRQGARGGGGGGSGDRQPRQPHPRRSLEDQDQSNKEGEVQELRSVVSMLTTSVIRQEAQQLSSRQDTAFMIFAQTHVPDSLARSMFQVGQAWHAKKKDDPASLSAPDASSAVPALHQRDSGQVSRHDENSFFEVHGGELGMAVPMWQGGLWDPLGLGTAEAEARQGYLRSIPQEIEQMLEELLVVATKPLVIHRFHAARRLASEYQSPVLGLFLEVGMRTTEAQTAWKLLHRMARSSTWATGGCFLRNERMQMSALAKRLSTLTV